MKILFIARHYSYLRLFESAVVELARRGHEIVLAADREEALGGRQMVERIAAAFPKVRLVDAPGRHAGAWSEVSRRVRLGLDFLRFLEPQYADTPHLRNRARARAPQILVRLAESASPGRRRLIASVLRWLERGLPSDVSEPFIAKERPDAVLITPLVDMGSPQLEHLTAARRLGLRTMLPVGSWDHLSSKALLRTVPDLITVWNPVQKAEAVNLHGVPADRVVVTGAQCYDQWFDRQPSTSYETFCGRAGLPADRPFLLYVCSSLFQKTAHEPEFVEQWIRAVRSSGDPRLKDIGILVRPHPGRMKEWAGVDLTQYANVAFWGAHPVDQDAKDGYFDSLYYSSAVVGLNTSAFIEAAAVGKPVFTVLLPEISTTNQEGTIHFRYLMDVGGGLLRPSRSLDEHIRQLADGLVGHGGGDPKAAGFTAGFVRPFGPHEPATPRFADAVESLLQRPVPAPDRRGAADWAAFAVLYPVTAAWALHLRTQVRRKRVVSQLRKGYERRKLILLRKVKEIVSGQFVAAGRKRKVSTPSANTSLTPKAAHRRDPSRTMAGVEFAEAKEARELVTVLGRSGKPIILGPWLSETGFELLYWVPFLAWARAYGNFDPSRLIVVSRGGVSGWYEHITREYEDVFSFYSPDEFRVRNEQRIAEQGGRLKHVAITSFDREILEKVKAKRGLSDAEVLHPSVMYQLFDHFWLQRTPVALIGAFTSFASLTPSPVAGIREHLPARYVAAKFYGNVALPSTPENDVFVRDYLTALSREHDVVLLNTPHQFDDHHDFPPDVRGRLHTVEHLMTPETNLAVQTEVIRGAEAFVGTYGGFSYLAPLLGVNTVAFYSHAGGFRADHLEVAKRAFAALQCGTFTEVDLRAVPALRIGLGGMPAGPAGEGGSR